MVPVETLPMVELPLPYLTPKEHMEEAAVSYVYNPSSFYLILGKQGASIIER